MMTPVEVIDAMLAAKTESDAAIAAYRTAVLEHADADDVCRRAMARAFVEIRDDIPGKPTVAYLEALVDERTAEVQRAAVLSDGYKRAAAMRVDAAKQWMSSLQSIAASNRAEAEFAKWEPRDTSAA